MYRYHLQGSRTQKKASAPSTEFIQGKVWAVKSLSGMVSANRVVASGRVEGSVGVKSVT